MLCCGRSKEPFSCHVELLDGNHLNFSRNQNVKLSTKAHILFEAVCLHLNLIEHDYFGISYYDSQSHKCWLKLDKALCEDATFMNGARNTPCVLYFGVKFYAADPCSLKEEVTRYQFFLQLKKDILTTKLTCSWKKAAEVSALALQSEIGDYHPTEHKRGYVSEFRFLPNQDEKFESEVARLHATFQGLVPSSAEMQYLRKCHQFDLYGVEMHSVKGEAGVQYTVGISPRGIETFKNKYRIAIHHWSRIEHLDCKEEYLKLQVKNKQGKMTSHSFQLRSPSECQYVWKSMVEHHVFYRLPQNIPNTDWNKKYRYSGRTEAEILQSEVEREEPEVERGSSKRYPPRIKDNNDEKENENQENKAEKSNEESTWKEVLDKKGMFSVADADQNTSVKYMTPKNERRERNRQLQSMSDNENRARKHRSHRGRSSGEESDSPSKRRIRARTRHNRSNIGSDVSESSHVRRRRRKYYTDTEMANGGSGDPNRVKRRNNNSPGSGSQARRNKRLSREEVAARQQLWEHINRDVIDPSDRSPEQLRDIPYTEVKTQGNSVPVKVRHNRRRHSSGKRTSGVSTNSYTQALEEGMVSPLPITTTVQQERQRAMYSNGHRHKTPHSKPPGEDWDTRTSVTVDGFQSSGSRSKQHRPRQRRNPNSERKDQSLSLVYSQI